MSKIRILVLVRDGHVPPSSLEGVPDEKLDAWKAEYDVCETLRGLGHEVLPLGVYDDLAPIRNAIQDFKPDITFMMLEESFTASLPTTLQSSVIWNSCSKLTPAATHAVYY